MEGILKKISYEGRDYIWVGRRKEPILKLCHEKRRKKESGHKWDNDLLINILCILY